jgi:hypothetical protein
MVADERLGFQRGNLSKLRWFVPGGELFGLEQIPGTAGLGQKFFDFLEEKSLYLIAIGALASYAGHSSNSPLKYTLMMSGGALVFLGIAPYVYGVIKDL